MTPYPVLLCIPHSGQVMPKELEGRVVITTHEVFEDSDAYTKEIFDLGSKVIQVISTEYARAFIDMNRNLEDIPPAVPDGMIKSMTCYQTPIYKEGKEPDENLIGKLVSKYYRPYHNEIVDALKNSDLKLGLDCHSMAAFGPDISPDVGQKRPTICLGNCLDKTCTRDTISNLADCFSAGFEIKREEIKINKPFLGKYTTQRYGLKSIPWVHVELNRKFFLEKPWFDNDSMLVDNSRLKELNKMFEKTLSLFFEE